MLPEASKSFPNIPSISVSNRSLKSRDSGVREGGRARGEERRGNSEGEEEGEEEEEPSLSAPSSPKLKSPLHQKLSHSCDDLLSSSQPVPASAMATTALPSSSQQPKTRANPQPSTSLATPTSPGRAVPTLYRQDLDESEEDDSDSSSESDLEELYICDDNSRPSHTNLGTLNSLVDLLEEGGGGGGGGGRRGASPEGRWSRGDGEVREAEAKVLGGKFSKFKGKLLQMKSSTSSFLSRPRSRSPQPSASSEGTTAAGGGGATKRVSSPATLVEGEGSEGSLGLHQNQRVSLVKHKFRMSSPGLWRKMRRSSPSAPSEEELSLAQARRNCRSRIIYIT